MSTAHEKKVRFTPEKVTKNTVRFTEELESDMDVPVIGTLYVQKTALKGLGYTGEGTIVVTLEVE